MSTFLRHTPADPEAVAGRIPKVREDLELACRLHDPTAAQYTGLRNDANALFTEALLACRDHGWRRLEHFVLHHWGRSRVEEGELDDAERLFTASRAIRKERGDLLVTSSDKALSELAKIRAGGEQETAAVLRSGKGIP